MSTINIPDIPNIIVYGQTGSGKSSIINMIPGNSDECQHAPVSNSARGITTKATCYQKVIYGKPFNVWDSPGLNEGDKGTVEGKCAVEILHNLVSTCTGGVNLLVLVMRAPRINAFLNKSYNLLFDIICHKDVPIVLVVTGLDLEEERRVWWDMNKGAFHQYGIHPHGHACVTTLARTGAVYERSRDDIMQVIHDKASICAWKMPSIPLDIAEMISRFLTFLGVKKVRQRDLAFFNALKDIYGEHDARDIMKRIRKHK